MTWLTWIAARPDGELFVVADDAGRLRIWSPAENRVVAKHVLPSRVRRAEWTSDGQHVVAIDEGDTLHVFSGDGARREASIATGHESVYGLSVHPSRALAATTGDDGHVRVWDLATEKAILDVEEPSTGSVTALSEKHLAAGWRSGHFVAWDLETGKDLAGGEIFAGYVASMAFSNDGVSLVCGGSKGSLVAIRSTDWTASAVWKGTPPKPISTNAIAFEPRSSRFVCAHSDDTASLFSGAGDRAPSSLGFAFYVDKKPWKEEYIVSCACFVPSAPLILTSHFDGRLQVWKQEPSGLVMPAATITFDEATDAPVFTPRSGGPIADPAAWWAEKSGRTARTSSAPIDLSLRERVLAEFATSAAIATDVAGLGRAAARIPHTSGIKPRSKEGGMTLDFAPPIAAAKLSAFLGWNEDILRGPDSRPRIGVWLVTLPEVGRRAGDAIAELHLALGGVERTRYLGGRDPWQAPVGSSNDALSAITKRVLEAGEAPKTVGSLEEALGVTIDRAALAASTMGRLTVGPSGSIVMNVSGRYSWSPDSEVPVTKLDDLRARDLHEWSATFSEGFEALDTALRERFGAPRMRHGHHVYSTWILGGTPGHPVTLSFHPKLPDWAVEPPDPAIRARALRDLATVVAAAKDAAAVERAASARPAGAGLVLEGRRESEGKQAVVIELVPAMQASELASVLGWQSPAAQTFARLQNDWHVRLVTGRKDHVPETALPSFGPHGVFASLDGRPTGGPLPGAIGGPPGGTHLFGPKDVVRFLRILV